MGSKFVAVMAGMLLVAVVQPAMAQKKYGPGVTDTEIKLGQTQPYSGPASALSVIGRVQAAYLKMINAKGGINGRKVNLLSLDDGLSPPKAVEQTRKLVEGDGVLAIFYTVGSGPNLSIMKYLNSNGVPQMFAGAGSPKLVEDPVANPWTTSFYSTLALEAQLFATYILENKPNAKLGVIYQTDESGKAYLEGMKVGLGEKASSILVKEVGFDLTFPTIDSQILQLQAAGVDTIFFGTTAPKFAAQGVRKVGELGWKPQLLLSIAVTSIEATLKPAGLEYATGAVTALYAKEPESKTWEKDQGMADYFAFMKEWAPNENAYEGLAVTGYSSSQMLVETLKRCGDDLTRGNLNYQATHVKDFQLPMFIPGVKITITPEDRIPWKSAQMARFDGKTWEFFGGVVTARTGK